LKWPARHSANGPFSLRFGSEAKSCDGVAVVPVGEQKSSTDVCFAQGNPHVAARAGHEESTSPDGSSTGGRRLSQFQVPRGGFASAKTGIGKKSRVANFETGRLASARNVILPESLASPWQGRNLANGPSPIIHREDKGHNGNGHVSVVAAEPHSS
jgi:hypothetical protein